MERRTQQAGEPALSAGREALLREHLSLARSLAASILRQHHLPLPLEDLEAYARAGLLEAAQRFDPSRSVPFACFARYRVQGAIWDGVRAMGWEPRRRNEARFAEGANAYLEAVAEDRPAEPTRAAAALEQRSASLATIYLAATAGCLEEQPDEGEPGALRRLERAQLELGLRPALQRLPAREAHILRAVYFEGRGLSSLTDELGLSLPWISRLHRRAVERLQAVLREQGLLT